MKNLAVLIAEADEPIRKSLPGSWEVIACDHRRLGGREVKFSSQPDSRAYDQIVIVKPTADTALTQRRIACQLQAMAVEGNIRFACAKAASLLAHRHQDLLVHASGGFIEAAGSAQPIHDKYLIAIVGMPATGKSKLAKILRKLPGFSSYKWGRYACAAMVDAYGEMSKTNGWDSVKRFTVEIESQDRAIVARKMVQSTGILDDESTFVIVDGIKSKEQIDYCSEATGRPVIVVRLTRNEPERLEAVLKRGDFDDGFDSERTVLLRDMGAIDVMDGADFVVRTDGNNIDCDKEQGTCFVRLSSSYQNDVHTLLSWLFMSGSLQDTRSLLEHRCYKIGRRSGYDEISVDLQTSL